MVAVHKQQVIHCLGCHQTPGSDAVLFSALAGCHLEHPAEHTRKSFLILETMIKGNINDPQVTPHQCLGGFAQPPAH